jgi:hypothetical protein
MSKCRHPKKSVTTKTFGWTQCCGDKHCSGAAHGGVTHVETCSACGAIRKTETNGRYESSRGWQAPE